ncbi:MAG: FKBP-type peptidyl-prolyl cis-trans isomerase [Crocinitomicaceae bacterium]|nr:FKBP-type peptidyl-prolyl cis-trans isomerase [Crocinitomicaceae bacterium]MDG1776338.1 FKBP-type peptidyl-prolyl cis-trans isomerase [Crocinitomicaceae bacterium]
MKNILLFLTLGLLLISCNKAEKQAQQDEEIIKQYISDHNLDAIETGTGLYVVINNPGTGASCNATSDVTVDYKGYFTEGTIFDESNSTGITFNLSGVIAGWTEGIPYFKEGGHGILLVPSALGYGDQSNGGIPANTVLIFDVSLLEVL